MRALDNLRVILASPRNPLNIGAAARAMHNFGFRHLRLVDPYDVAYHEARSAVHAGDLLRDAQVYQSLPEALADCSLIVGTTALNKRELNHTVRRLESGGELLRQQLASSSPTALLFGSEKYGLSNTEMSYCHWLLTIGSQDSMNLGQAVAVCLYELTRREPTNVPEERRPATSGDLQRLEELTTGVLRDSGYVHSQATDLKVRRLLHRLHLEAHDAEIWLGVLRQIAWKLKQK
jgi:TrmH family RNA methyltransferase